ncbi:hypothetical protein [Ottowia testudinis]|uniref:DUF4148 domain-containing protein n=1 Tax=Ottowia testudinis TaxID=2816950 RepID=A0A975CF27_9BURK|nr:hypothetical protein [Ottowia testudinis]QTD45263.1 hypothetical protein J1M35_19980 [Ottowia testudinis]
MTKFTAAFASAAALLLAGNAFAQMPAAGEGPLFLNESAGAPSVSRADVRAAGAQKTRDALAPRRHEADQASLMNSKSTPTRERAEVRAQTRDALQHGYKLNYGDM